MIILSSVVSDLSAMDLDNCPAEDISRGNWGVTSSLHWRDVCVSCPLVTVSVSRVWSVVVDCKLSTASCVSFALVLEIIEKKTLREFLWSPIVVQPFVQAQLYWSSLWHYLYMYAALPISYSEFWILFISNQEESMFEEV